MICVLLMFYWVLIPRTKKIVASERQRPNVVEIWWIMIARTQKSLDDESTLIRRDLLLQHVKAFNEGRIKAHKIHSDERDAARNIELAGETVADADAKHWNKHKHQQSGISSIDLL